MNLLHQYNPVHRTPEEIDVGTWKIKDAYAEWLWRAEHNYSIPLPLTRAVIHAVKLLYAQETHKAARKEEWEKKNEAAMARIAKLENKVISLQKKARRND